MTVSVHVQNSTKFKNIPPSKQFNHWINVANTLLPKINKIKNPVIVIRMITSKESAEFNKNYRGKEGPTNILSFNYEPDQKLRDQLLGDLAICPDIVRTEARTQKKTIISHWAHLTIHGFLHLLGFDHQIETEAQVMEKLEIKILAKLGYKNPYEE